MKHGLLTFLLLAAATLGAQAAQLTLRVNMQGQTVGVGGVHVAGSFQSEAGFPADWNPATTALTDLDGDGVYEVTVSVPAGVYYYKFINGNAWPAAEPLSAGCAVDDGGGNLNREVTVGAGALRLPVPAFGGCLTQVKLSVNMQGQAVAAGGVHVAGNFQAMAGYGPDWDPASLPLSDPDGDGTYEVRLALPAPGRFQYKFINGAAWAGAETVPATCGTDDGSGNLNRVLDATAAVSAPPAVCFGQCAPCGEVAPRTDYATHWWNDAVFYEVFVRSFQDSNGDGIGDFRGLISRLDYLNDGNPATTTDLGVTGIWLMPMMESPSYHGYDVTNYQATEPDYGTMADFEALLAAAHARGIKVIIDLVLNHASSQHPWFQQAANSPANTYRDWFRWSATRPAYAGPWGQNVWHARNGSYYYGLFYDGMPDLNWNNAALKATMWDATRFWLNKGVDGYRLDAVKYLNEDGAALENTPATLATLQEFGQVVRTARPAAFTVGEAWSPTPRVVPYVSQGRLDACFEFDLAVATIDALNFGNPAGLTTKLSQVANAYPQLQYATFLANHDQDRILEALGGNAARMRQAAALYLTMPGVPFLYYGEEIGLLGKGPDEEKRKPMQWTAAAGAGFTTGTPWRAVGANLAQANVATQQADSSSLLRHYQRLIGLRTAHEDLRKGYLLPVTTPTAGVVSYGRVYGSEATIVVANVSAAAARPAVSVAVSTLPAGTYQATDLYSGQAAGPVTVDARGALSGWAAALPALAANQTWLLHLSRAQVATATTGPQAPLALALYPNPAATQVRLELRNAPAAATRQLSVYDLTGRRQHAATFSGARHTLDTSAWAAGTYFVRIQTGRVVTMQRLVVAR
ncbi:alpha-amylase family glycosyl hydrolase [uncultured Hymenobacter sp.]|uniref:alpha-amylase family glycosyl hydrolase n=1 Tax=uncultured Hymenobacter sp. TaxID=170016 RepID=UPI0035CB1991